MNYSKILIKLVDENNGVITSKMVTEAGIPRAYLAKFAKQGILQKCERGIYMLAEGKSDWLYCFQLRYPQTIFSHESALYIQRYIEVMPEQIVATVKTGTNTKNLVNTRTRIHSISPKLFNLGEIDEKTDFGRTIRTYDIERSICDVVRNRSRIDNDIIIYALKKYNGSPEKDFSKLISYAEKLKVSNALNNYLEFL